ncbi:hypothetical protein [Pantoea piersonii]|uniref:hypothetical protein n=1 Tax=Pantoea piersonii TaxID=2364647 RepID=UPI0022F156C7|nr:hypothetical protein [Pantoea piersonii]WBV20203.1 hypothetical protein PG877_11210 [Pantoea piersonii]
MSDHDGMAYCATLIIAKRQKPQRPEYVGITAIARVQEKRNGKSRSGVNVDLP